MIKNKLTYGYWFLILISLGCRDPYEPNLPGRGNHILVVEGFINSGNGPTTITLSRVNDFGEREFKPEANALVAVEGESGYSQQLAYHDLGRYTSELQIDAAQKYRVRIWTSDKEYLSDFVKVIVAPDIDSIYWQPLENGVQIMVSSKDHKNQTRYYRWEYEETWTVRAPYWTNLIYKEEEGLVGRSADEMLPLVCYDSDIGSKILLHSTAHLEEDVINKHPLLQITNQTGRLQYRYSILVRQYGLEKEAFQFCQNIEKNTESTGSVFDPLPIELESNIKCVTDPDEMVVGFISAGEYKEKRIFIGRAEIETELEVKTKFDHCKLIVSDVGPPAYLLAKEIISVIGYNERGDVLSAPTECVDCSKTASPIMPDFWQ